mmetsp:Transcript_12435/g.37370  ORF Transcript_12435/g.37370 Transcript_12435/m.37370 type:complete len:264 (+) Transcript_12435:359-1150(+)
MAYHCSTCSGADASSPPTFMMALSSAVPGPSPPSGASPRKRRISSFSPPPPRTFSTISMFFTSAGLMCSSKLRSPACAGAAEKVMSSPRGVELRRRCANSPAASRMAPSPMTTKRCGPRPPQSSRKSSSVFAGAAGIEGSSSSSSSPSSAATAAAAVATVGPVSSPEGFGHIISEGANFGGAGAAGAGAASSSSSSSSSVTAAGVGSGASAIAVVSSSSSSSFASPITVSAWRMVPATQRSSARSLSSRFFTARWCCSMIWRA